MPASLDLIGKTLARRYRVVREIGRGGMGVVYEALQLDLKRKVALKVVFDADSRTLERFEQEALATANLACPNVVTVLEFRADPDQPPFFAMELLEGEPLSSIIAREGPLPITRAVDITAQMLNGLAAAHRAGIVHRDIKPSNVFLVRTAMGDDVVKLLDFGVAKVRESSLKTTTGALTGTPAYVSPEQLRAQPVDARTDLHAVGVVLFEMLTGRKPWRAEGGPELSTEILREPPLPASEFRKAVPPELVAIVDAAMRKEPAARPQDANAMLVALRPWIVRGSDPRLGIATPAMAFETANAPTERVDVVIKPRVRSMRSGIAIFTAVTIAVLAIGLTLGFILIHRRTAEKAPAPAVSAR